LTGAAHYIYEKGMPRGVPTSPEKEARIVARLLVERHASLVARDEGVSFAKVWRLAERECIELTAGYEARGYWRLSPERRAAVIEARRDNPGGTQQEIARAAGVSRATVSRIERGDRRRGPAGPKVG
jgi:hypothetical protein